MGDGTGYFVITLIAVMVTAVITFGLTAIQYDNEIQKRNAEIDGWQDRVNLEQAACCRARGGKMLEGRCLKSYEEMKP